MANDKDLAALVAEQAEQIEALKNLVQEQGAKLSAISEEVPTVKKEEKLETPKDTFKVGKETYQFTVPKYIKPGKGVVRAIDILNNKDDAELERLVSIKSTIVKLATK